MIEQQQPDGSIRPLSYLSSTTLDDERKWSISELECAAIVWATKRNRQMFYGIPFEVETDYQPLQNLASLSDKSNRVQIWFDFPECVHFYARTQIEERQRQRRHPRPVAPPSSSHRRRSSAQVSPDRPLRPRCLLRRRQQNSPLKSSNVVGLKFGWTGQHLGWTGADDVFFVGGGSSARAQEDGQQWRAASKRFLTDDEAQHEQGKGIEAVHPLLTWASQDEERSTEFLLDDDSPLVQPTIHAIVEGQLEPGVLLSACPLTQEGMDFLQQTRGVVSAVTRSVTRERARPFSRHVAQCAALQRAPFHQG